MMKYPLTRLLAPLLLSSPSRACKLANLSKGGANEKNTTKNYCAHALWSPAFNTCS